VWVDVGTPGGDSQLFSEYSIRTDTLEAELNAFSELVPGNEGTPQIQHRCTVFKKIILLTLMKVV